MGTDIAYRVSGSRKVINNNLFVQDVEKIICIVNNHIAEFYIKINSIQEVGLCPTINVFFHNILGFCQRLMWLMY